MRSKISFFNKTVFRKDITRFFPAWTIYSIVLALGWMIVGDGVAEVMVRGIGDYLSVLAVINCGYALLCAQLLFGDLYQTRMCNALHAMPMRRETWFFTHCLAGLCFAAVPNTVLSRLMILLLREYWAAALMLLLGSMLMYAFFFGGAVFSVMCTGSRFAMAAVYGILNVIPLLLLWVAKTLYEPLLYGVVLRSEPFLRCCPLATMVTTEYTNIPSVRFDANDPLPAMHFPEVGYSGFEYLSLCALAGVVLAGAALLLYRRRSLESAGEFIVVKGLRPVFLVLFCLSCGTALGGYLSLFLGRNTLLYFFIGVAVGFFAGQMLLKRTARVFTKRVLAGFFCFAVAIAASAGVTKLDPLGITQWVPDAGQVESVSFSLSGTYGREFLFDGEEIGEILTFHRYAVENPVPMGEQDETSAYLRLHYTMKDGRKAERNYLIRLENPIRARLSKLLSRPEMVFQLGKDFAYRDRFLYVNLNETLVTDQELIDALLLDCEAGTMAQNASLHTGWSDTVLVLTFLADDGKGMTRYITIYPECENTWQWFEFHGYGEVRLTGTDGK